MFNRANMYEMASITARLTEDRSACRARKFFEVMERVVTEFSACGPVE